VVPFAGQRGRFDWLEPGQQFEPADHGSSLARGEGHHRVAEEVRCQHLADAGDHLTNLVGEPDKDPSLVALIADPGDEALELQPLE
jgi:hypothetical protein